MYNHEHQKNLQMNLLPHTLWHHYCLDSPKASQYLASVGKKKTPELHESYTTDMAKVKGTSSAITNVAQQRVQAVVTRPFLCIRECTLKSCSTDQWDGVTSVQTLAPTPGHPQADSNTVWIHSLRKCCSRHLVSVPHRRSLTPSLLTAPTSPVLSLRQEGSLAIWS